MAPGEQLEVRVFHDPHPFVMTSRLDCRAVISEFGGANNQNCFNVCIFYCHAQCDHLTSIPQFIDDLLTYMEDNDEYIGWSAWAAGPRTLLYILSE